MNKIQLSDITAKINTQREIRVEDIPDMELYMEQLLGFLNHQLAHHNGDPEKVFTKTMINNYTKDGILIPPKNKKYSRQHVMLLALIHNIKGILPINDIKLLLAPVLRDTTTAEDDLLPLESIYSTYLELSSLFLSDFNKAFAKRISFINDLVDKTQGEADAKAAQKFLTILALVAQANMNKSLAEILLNDYVDYCEQELGITAAKN